MFIVNPLRTYSLPRGRQVIAIMGATLLTLAMNPVFAENNVGDSRILQSAYAASTQDLGIRPSIQKNHNISIIEQRQGIDNRAFVEQVSQGSAYGNLAFIKQSGNANEASILQYGSDNNGQVIQQGNGLSHQLRQIGNQQAIIQQDGHNAHLSLSQSGSGLRAMQIRQWAPSGAGTSVTIDTR